MTFRTLLAAAAVLLAAPAAAAQSPALPVYDRPADFDGMAKSSRYIESFDGTKLAVTIWRPTQSGAQADEPLPVVVMQMRMESQQVAYFVRRGYVVVGQDRRGTGASFGVQTGFVNPRDAQDAKAVIEWAGAQPFSNSKVVAMGCSNQGAWQYVTAALKPKHLVAIAPACSSPQFFDDAVSISGVPMFETRPQPYNGECAAPAPSRSGQPGPPVPPRGAQPVDEDADGAMLKEASERRNCNAVMLGQYYLHMPRDGANAFDGYKPAITDSAISHAAAIKTSGIAILQIGGWYDAAVPGQMASQSYWGGRVIMGPWIHGNRPPPGSAFPNPSINLDAETLRWFDFHAKGIRNGADQPGVFFYTINAPAGQEWKSAARWRWRGERQQTLYFGQSELSAARPARSVVPIVYQGRDVRLFEGRYQPLNRWWGGDMSASASQSLSQTGAPFQQDTEMTGAPLARLWVSADTADANIYAVLEDVAPDGKSSFVTDGRIRASWRKRHPAAWGVSEQIWHRGYAEDLQPLKEGEIVELAFDLLPMSYVFRKGHRARLSLSTSIGEAYQAPPLAAGRAPAIKLYRDRAHPSAVTLPIVRMK